MRFHNYSFTLGILTFLLITGILGYQPDSSVGGQQSQSVTNQAFSISKAKGPKSNVPSTQKLAKRARYWTASEEELLLKLRDEDGKPWPEMEEDFEGRKWKAIKAKYYKLTKDESAPKKTKRKWTTEETALLMDLLGQGMKMEDMVERFPGRDLRSIKARYRYLTKGMPPPTTAFKTFTAAEDALILELRDAKTPWVEMARSFEGRDASTVRRRYEALRPSTRKKIDRSRKNIHKKWTAKDDDELIAALETDLTREEIAVVLDRTYYAIVARVTALKKAGRLDPTVHSIDFPALTAADFELMREEREKGMSWTVIAERYFKGRPAKALRETYSRHKNRKIDVVKEKDGDNVGE